MTLSMHVLNQSGNHSENFGNKIAFFTFYKHLLQPTILNKIFVDFSIALHSFRSPQVERN